MLKVGKLLGRPVGTGRGVLQGDPESPMIFNFMVDVVVKAVMEEVCVPQESHNGMVWAAGERELVFFTDDRGIMGRVPYWVQESLEIDGRYVQEDKAGD